MQEEHLKRNGHVDYEEFSRSCGQAFLVLWTRWRRGADVLRLCCCVLLGWRVGGSRGGVDVALLSPTRGLICGGVAPGRGRFGVVSRWLGPGAV